MSDLETFLDESDRIRAGSAAKKQKHRWQTRTLSLWPTYLGYHQQCTKCGVKLFLEDDGPRGGTRFYLIYKGGDKVVKAGAMPACRGTR